MLVAVIDQLSLTDGLLLMGAVGFAVKAVMDAKGWTKSSQILRRENQDLSDRNKTLEADKVDRLAVELQLRARIESLELKVRELEARDQASVLAALTAHEISAENRYEKTKVGDESRHAEHVGYLERIVVALESNPGGVA